MNTRSYIAGVVLSTLSLVGCSKSFQPLEFNGIIENKQVKYAPGYFINMKQEIDEVTVWTKEKRYVASVNTQTHQIKDLEVIRINDLQVLGHFSLENKSPYDSAAIAAFQPTIDTVVAEIPKIRMQSALEEVSK